MGGIPAPVDATLDLEFECHFQGRKVKYCKLICCDLALFRLDILFFLEKITGFITEYISSIFN